MSWPVNKEEILADLAKSFDTGSWWIYKGPKVEELQRRFAEFHDTRYGVATCNGTVPLEIVLTALGIGPGDKVLLPAYDFYSLPRSVVGVGATPVFADVDPVNLAVDCEIVERSLDEGVRAVVAVHLCGGLAKMDELQRMCRERGVFLIEDCAQATGAVYKGKHVGSWGDAGLFSFGGIKLMTSGQGGMIVTSDEQLADRCHAIANRGYGLDGGMNRHGIVGGNFQLSELAAIVLLPQLRVLGDLCARREEIMKSLDASVDSTPGISPFGLYDGTEVRSQFRYSFFVDKATRENGLRDSFVNLANETGIPLRPGHSSIGSDERLFSRFASEDTFPVADMMQHKVVSILHMDILERGAGFWAESLGGLVRRIAG